ncbi:MAG: hypothetical protein LBR35_02570 [Rickettsiales bacterium]|jgi:hypothetical protein|nr:hypothetical protein [Rickettsiales bacterium]
MTFASIKADAVCSAPLKNLLGITDAQINSSSPDFSCYDLLYLKRNTISNISFNDYLQMYPSDVDPQVFRNFDLDPAMATEINYTANQKRMPLTHQTVNKLLDEKTEQSISQQNVHLNPSGIFVQRAALNKTCSTYNFPEFSSLSKAHKPIISANGQLMSAFNETYGLLAPTQTDGLAMFKAGALPQKEIPWYSWCYTEGFYSVAKTLSSGCLVCPVYETLYDFISNYSYAFFMNIKDFVFLAICVFLIIKIGLRVLNAFYPFSNKPLALDAPVMNQFLKQAILLSVAATILLPDPQSFFFPRYLIEFIAHPILLLSKTLMTAVMGEEYVCSYVANASPGQFEMLGPSFKENYMCLVESSFVTLFKPVMLGFSMVLQLKMAGLVLIYIFLKNLFKISFYLLSPLTEIAKALFFLPLTIGFWVLDYKTDLFSWKKIWDALIQICFMCIFIAFFTMIIMELVKSVSFPELGNLSVEELDRLDYTAAGFWEIVIVGFLASYFLDLIPGYIKSFTGFLGVSSDFDQGLAKNLKDTALNSVKDVVDTRNQFQKSYNLRTDPKYLRGIKSIGKKIGGWFR